jgi:hypothetical chaperone protein
MGIAVGVDFGTSNSAAAVPGRGPGDPARVLAIDPGGDDARLLRSVLFFPEESLEVLAGAEAIARYLHDGSGRFIQSAKSFLHHATVETVLRRKKIGIPEIVAFLLGRIRERIEAEEGPIERLVLGRPAAFAPEPERDALAEERLLRAAALAGLPPPRLVIEPIAAALGYEATLERDELVLVGDFGAGTSDFTLMRLGPSRRHRADRREDVIASAGVRVGGDRFDAAIVEHRLLARFGAGSTYVALARPIPLPVWIPRKLLAWHELSLLRERSNMEFLHRVARTASDPEGLHRLIVLAEENLAFHMYRAVEKAKRELSSADRAVISFHAGDIDLEEPVTRAEFERWTAPLRAELAATLERLLAAAPGATPDAVFLTGGTSKIPSVRRMFVERFGDAVKTDEDAFTSVAAGLGRAAAA